MKKIFVNIFIFFVSLALFLSPIDVYAYNDNPWHNTLEDVQRFLGYLGCQIGALGNHDYTGFIDNMETFNAWCDNGYVDLREDGSIVASDQLVDDLKEYLDSYFKVSSDHWYEKSYGYSDCFDSSHDLGMLYAFSTLMNAKSDNAIAIASSTSFGNVFFRYNSSSVCYFVYGNYTTINGSRVNYYKAYDRNANLLVLSELGFSQYRFNSSNNRYDLIQEYMNYGGDPPVSFYYGSPHSTSAQTIVVSSTRSNVLCFKDLSALRRYVYGSVSSGDTHYATTSYLNYNPSIDNSITIDRSTVEYILNTENNFLEEISNVSSSIQTEISNYYTENNTTMSNTQIQQTIDDSVHNYITSLPSGGNTEDPDKPPVDPDKPDPPGGDVSGNNPGGTVSGGSISGNGVDGPQTVSFLSKIYSKLCEVYDFLSGAILDALKSIKNAIVANTLVDVAGGIADLISGGLDAVGGFMDDTAEAFAPVAEMLPEKFPTCIPWDLIAIFTVIVSSGSPPVYEVPVSIPRLGIDYTVTLDLSIFEPVAVLCRAFLSLLMVMMLIHMTIRLTSGGDN